MIVKEKEKLQEIEKTKIEIPVKEEKINKRDVSVDLIRVIACFIVILTHLCLQVLNQCFNRIDWSRLLEKSL